MRNLLCLLLMSIFVLQACVSGKKRGTSMLKRLRQTNSELSEKIREQEKTIKSLKGNKVNVEISKVQKDFEKRKLALEKENKDLKSNLQGSEKEIIDLKKKIAEVSSELKSMKVDAYKTVVKKKELKSDNLKTLKITDSILSDVTAVRSKKPKEFVDVSDSDERKKLASPDHPLLKNNAIRGISEKDLQSQKPAKFAILEMSSSQKQSPATEASSAKSIDKTIKELLSHWREAWEKKDIETFAGFYSQQFVKQGMDFNSWKKHTATTFQSNASVSVEISDIKIKIGEMGVVISSFQEIYRKGNYNQNGTKIFYWQKEKDGWKIFLENWKTKK